MYVPLHVQTGITSKLPVKQERSLEKKPASGLLQSDSLVVEQPITGSC